MNHIADQALEWDRGSVAEAAFLMDETAPAYLNVADPMGAELLILQLPQLHRAGLPVAHCLTDDVDKLSACRLIIVSSSLAPSPEFRRKLDALKSDNRVIVFLNGAGFLSDGAVNPEAIASFTGITVKRDTVPAKGPFTFQNSLDFCNLLQDKTFGTETYLQNPALLPNDPNAEVLARYTDGRIAIAARRYPQWTAVYAAQVQLPAQFYRNLAVMAGTHCYIDTPDVVLANRSMLAVSVEKPGPRTIRLPRPATVTELYTNKIIAEKSVSTFTYDFPALETRLFHLGY